MPQWFFSLPKWEKIATTSNTTTTTTLDSATKGVNASLTNGRLRYVSGNTEANDAAYSTTKASGKKYCEIKIVSTDFNSGTSFGVSTTNTYQIAFPYKSVDIHVYMGHGYVMSGGNFLTADSGTSFQIEKNDILSIAVDTEAGILIFRKNNTQQWEFSIPSGARYLVVAGDGNEIYDVNFGSTPFFYNPPTGYTAWN